MGRGKEKTHNIVQDFDIPWVTTSIMKWSDILRIVITLQAKMRIVDKIVYEDYKNKLGNALYSQSRIFYNFVLFLYSFENP